MDADKTVTANFVPCVTNLNGRGTPGNTLAQPRIDLTWTASYIGHYNVFRSGATGGPYTQVGISSANSFSDRTYGGLVNNTRYFYMLQPVSTAGSVICQSNEAGVTIPKGR